MSFSRWMRNTLRDPSGSTRGTKKQLSPPGACASTRNASLIGALQNHLCPVSRNSRPHAPSSPVGSARVVFARTSDPPCFSVIAMPTSAEPFAVRPRGDAPGATAPEPPRPARARTRGSAAAASIRREARMPRARAPAPPRASSTPGRHARARPARTGRTSRRGRRSHPARDPPTPTCARRRRRPPPMMRWYASSYSTSSTRSPHRSCVRSTGGCVFARSASRWNAAEPTCAPTSASAERHGVGAAAPSRDRLDEGHVRRVLVDALAGRRLVQDLVRDHRRPPDAILALRSRWRASSRAS